MSLGLQDWFYSLQQVVPTFVLSYPASRPFRLGAGTRFLGILSGCFPVRFEVEVSPAALGFLDTDTVCLGKTAYLRLTQTILLHDVKAGVVCFLLHLALFLVVLGNSLLDILFLKAVVPQAWTDAN